MGMSAYIRDIRRKIGNDLLLLPSIGAVIFDAHGHVLLQRAADDGKWYVPGGAIDPDEEPADAVVREVEEETGLRVVPQRIVSVTTAPLVTYPNGHRAQYVGITFLCKIVGGRLRVADDESLELRYFPPDELPELRPDHKARIEHALRNVPEALFVPPRASRG